MIALVLIAMVAITGFHTATYTLWLYEKRVHGTPQRREPLLSATVAWVGELAALIVVLVTWPLGLYPLRRPVRSRHGRPVALVHGWGMTPSSLAVLAARLRRDGRDTHIVGYSSTGPNMKAKAVEIDTRLRAILATSGADRLDVVAHGQGGLLVRAVARNRRGLEYLGNVVTIGTPHGGTALAALAAGPRLHPMRPRSVFLRGLAENDPVPSHIRVTAVFSSFDAIVFPTHLAEYPGALNVEIDEVGHWSLLFSGRVYQLVKENIDFAPYEKTT